MTSTEKLHFLRQVHPSWRQGERITSQAFRPTPKDNQKLSGYDGTLIEPKDSFYHFTQELHQTSVGVFGLFKSEATANGTPYDPDHQPHEFHASLLFESINPAQWEKVSRKLRDCAELKGCLYPIIGPD